MNIDISTLVFGLVNDLVILGTNSEMADMSNPHGNIEGLAHCIVAEAPNGRRFAHNATALTHNGYAENDITVERLERLAAHLNANHPALDADCWTEVQASYGSAAYVAGGWEARMLNQELDNAYIAGDISYREAQALWEGGCFGSHLS